MAWITTKATFYHKKYIGTEAWTISYFDTKTKEAADNKNFELSYFEDRISETKHATKGLLETLTSNRLIKHKSHRPQLLNSAKVEQFSGNEHVSLHFDWSLTTTVMNETSARRLMAEWL